MEHVKETRSVAIWIGGAILLSLVTFIAYIPAMDAGFIWDDDGLVTNNSLIKARDGILRAWWTDENPDYQPVTFSFFWIQWRLWGENPTGYHITNIVLHVINAILVWRILRGLNIPGSFLAALIFAVHPVNVASVAWVAEQKNTLSMIVYLLTFMAFRRYYQTSRLRWYVISLIVFAVALLSKGSVVMLPFVLLGYVWWERNQVTWRDWLRIVPFLALAFLFGLVTIHFQFNTGKDFALAFSPVQRIVLAGQAWWFYLYTLIWPANLIPVYPRWNLAAIAGWHFVFAASALAVILFVWLARKKIGKGPAAGILYFTINIFPVLGFLNFVYMNHSYVADHLQYLACLGPIALFAAVLALLFRRCGRAGSWIVVIAGVAIAVVLGMLTFRQGKLYKDMETYSWAILERNPESWSAYVNLDKDYAVHGKEEEGFRRFSDHLRRFPSSPEANNHMGDVWARKGDPNKALDYYGKALQSKPNGWDILNNIGTLYAGQQKFAEALPYFVSLVRLQPKVADAHYNLGMTYSGLGQIDPAISHLSEAARLKPGDADIRQALDAAMSLRRQLELDVDICRSRLKNEPANPDIYFKLGQLLERQGKADEAILNYRQAVELVRAAGKQDLVGRIQVRLEACTKANANR